jgi:hypothetical protein
LCRVHGFRSSVSVNSTFKNLEEVWLRPYISVTKLKVKWFKIS